MRRVVIAGMIGNGLEWYDFALYGYFAPVIGKLFFPAQDSYVQMLSAYGVFAAGFLMRPIGALLFGYLGDKYGRKFALTLSILMMAIPTACIGLLPTYAQIGILAPVLLTAIRLLQGLSLAGQFSGSIAFIVEHAPVNRRGFAGSTTVLSLCAGMLLGSGIATLVARLLSVPDFELYGWRIPFLLGIVIAFVGFYIRRHTEESPHYEKAKSEGMLSQTPLREVFSRHPGALLRGVGIYMAVTVPFYILTVFVNGFLSNDLGHPLKDALLISTVSMTVIMVTVPVTGWLTDLFGRKRIMVTTAFVYLFATYPLFHLLIQPGFASAFTAEVLLVIMISFYIGPAPTVFVELFPTSVRYTGMALSYNICAALFGGTAPLVAKWLTKKENFVGIADALRGISPSLADGLLEQAGMKLLPAYYIMLCAVLSLIAFIGYHDRYKEELH